MKNGFTLVELSIVMVIIGLLVGGVLVGQSLIESAKIQGQVRQIQQYAIIVKSFKDKFKQIPGDSILFTPAGNNNGCFNEYGNACLGGLNLADEPMAFWRHLSDSNLIDKDYSEIFGASGGVAGVNYPKAAFDNMAITVTGVNGSNAVFSVLADSGLVKIYLYSAAKYTQTGSVSFPSPKPNVALVAAIDLKIDDGIPLRGEFNAFVGGSASFCYDTSDVTGPYKTSAPDAVCSFILKLDEPKIF